MILQKADPEGEWKIPKKVGQSTIAKLVKAMEMKR
jgi:hypothetical protein